MEDNYSDGFSAGASEGYEDGYADGTRSALRTFLRFMKKNYGASMGIELFKQYLLNESYEEEAIRSVLEKDVTRQAGSES